MKSPERICSVCGRSITLSSESWKDTPGHAYIFCSPSCIERQLLLNTKEFYDRTPKRKQTKNPVVSEEYTNYSCLLRMNFRSEFEVLVAEYFTQMSVHFWYEKVTLGLFEDTKHWTPDFYMPEARTFVEVKGVWALGGRKKYIEAVRTIEEPIILIPYWMKELFRLRKRIDLGP